MAAIARWLEVHGANITELDQHATAPEGGWFFLRLEFAAGAAAGDLRAAFAADVAGPMELEFTLEPVARRKRLAVLVSRYEHCLLDLLTRERLGELHADWVVVVSNHQELRGEVERAGLRFVHIPVTRETKPAAEERLLEVLRDAGAEVVVLARYMQILSGGFLDALGVPVINIHHSFLPAFAGADPYARAHARGVKIIGATAHYVTEELDAGPIIEQDVARVSHRATVAELERVGRDVERAVLARAVRWHLDDRVAVHDGTTVVFA